VLIKSCIGLHQSLAYIHQLTAFCVCDKDGGRSFKFHCVCAETSIFLLPVTIWTAPHDSATNTPITYGVQEFSFCGEWCGRESHIFSLRMRRNWHNHTSGHNLDSTAQLSDPKPIWSRNCCSIMVRNVTENREYILAWLCLLIISTVQDNRNRYFHINIYNLALKPD